MIAIVGSNFGDEGKGLITDYYCSKHAPSYVVRFNGGCQAGHTVELNNGIRHIFHHFGSGTLRGVPTILSRYFIVNPILFLKEYTQLNYKPDISIHPDCLVTTPYDMMLNHIINLHTNHGTCGIGLNETIQRSKNSLRIEYRDLFVGDGLLREQLEYIRDIYVKARLLAYGIGEIHEQYKNILYDAGILNRFIKDCSIMVDIAKLNPSNIYNNDNIIFEGAQGLLLDQDHRFFPHVTHSKTGLHNVLKLTDKKIDVVYVARLYFTRHGAGPFPSENNEIRNWFSIIDRTNIWNEHQGSLRLGYFDFDLFAEAIKNDLSGNESRINSIKIAITCADQYVGGFIYMPIVKNGEIRIYNLGDFVDLLEETFNASGFLISRGPTSKTIEEVV